MKKLLGMAFVMLFMMSMTSTTTFLQIGPLGDCEDLAALELEISGDQDAADQVFSDCVDDEINELKEIN